MNKFNWALGLLTFGALLIISDIVLQFSKPTAKNIAVGMGLTGTGLVIIGILLLFSLKSEIKI